MKQYLDMLRHIRDNGNNTGDRTGTGTRSVFAYQMRTDLTKGFPLLTTKKVFIKAVIYELLWFLRGDTNIKFLVDNDVKIWNEWAFSSYLKKNDLEKEFPRYSDVWNEKFVWFIDQIKASEDFANQWGDLGPIYGKQWVNWEDGKGNHINQIQENVIDLIQQDPTSRRIIVSGWNVGDIQELIRAHHSAPPPCHTLFQFKVYGNKLSCQLYMRSADVFLGVPFNIASYALLTMMIAQVTGLEPHELINTFGDVHIYNNHMDQVNEQLSREPRPLPTMKLNPDVKNLFDFKFEDFELIGYDPHPAIKAPISV